MDSVDICNLALNFLGKGRIDSLSDNNELARTCKLHYDRYRKILLTEYSWSFAQMTTKLEEIAEDKLKGVVTGWRHAYIYPEKCLQIIRVYTDKEHKKDDHRRNFFVQSVEDFSLGKKVICTNENEAYMDYINNVEDVGYFPNEFIEALSHYLAYGMAQALAGSESKAQTELQYMQYALAQAKLKTAQEREHKPSTPDKYYVARF